jgi:hypothetical protein
MNPSHSFAYEATDIPVGMSIHEYRYRRVAASTLGAQRRWRPWPSRTLLRRPARRGPTPAAPTGV